MKANKEYRIKITTNYYQAARNPIFKSHSNEAYYNESYESKDDAIEGLKEIALSKVGDDYLVYNSEADALAFLISDHCYDAKINEQQWIDSHPRMIKLLADKYEYSGPGIYLNFATLDIRGNCKPGCEFKFGSEYFNYDGYTYEVV